MGGEPQLAAAELDARQAAVCGVFARLPLALLPPDGPAAAGECNWSGRQLRALNELPTLLLVIVVLLVVFKQQFPTGAATWLTVGLVVFMAASIQFYARWRRLRAEREAAHAG